MPGLPANDERQMPRLNLPRRASPPAPLPSPARAAPLPGHRDPCTLGAPRTPARPGWRGVAGLLLGLTTLSAVPAQAQWVVIETVDCAADLNTVCTVAVGGTAKGALDYASLTLDIDGWTVMLEEDQTYQIDLKGLDTGDGTLPDPWISLYDPGDNFLTDDVGGGVGRNSRITYTVPSGQGGRYYIYVESDQLIAHSNLATYTLTVVNTANTAPTGRPAISGTARLGQVLTAGTTAITDADGLTSPNFIYQWVRVDGGTETEIASATSSTYTPVAADVGKRLKVRVCFTDDGGSAEGPLTSDATEVVPASAFSVADASAEEGDAIEFVVSLSPAVNETVTVTYATSVESGDMATSGDDFTAASGTLTFAANETQKTISVITLEDTVFEGDETFTLTLSNVQSTESTGLVGIADETATGTIDGDILDERDDCDDGASFGTRCGIDHAELRSGSIASATDLDAWSVILDPGKTYQIDVRGAGDPGGDNPGTLADPSVALIEWDYPDDTGAISRDQRASNDNVSPANKNARITYTHHPADQLQRVFYIVVSGVSGSTGTYTVIFRDVTPADRETNNCAANRNTACNIEVGGTVTGSLSTAQDTDTWRVSLRSAKTYQVDVRGADSNGGTLADPTMQLQSYDSSARDLAQVAAADNGGTGEDARLTYAVPPSKGGGNYYISIGGNGSTGSYTLSVIKVASTQQQREESPLTAEFRNMPAEHDGTSFTFEFHFSESPEGLSYKTLRDSFFDVTNGTVRKAGRLARGDNSGWRITVEPDDVDEVQISFLPSLPSDDCADAAVVCTADGRRLSNGATAFVSGKETPLTAEFRNMPAEHDGTSFTFEFHFSESPEGLSYKTLRDSFFDVTNGTVRKAGRLARGDNSGWRITVEPDDVNEVQISFLPSLLSDDCADAAVVCTADGRRLSNGAATFVSGPASFSVADATVREAAGATLDFVVTLSRARDEVTTVDYTTSDGTARASEDYAAASGTLTFARGAREQTVSVLVLDDEHDEGHETLELTLSNASGAAVTDGVATGTIENHDPMPRALMSRFGRTAAVHVVQHVEERLQARREPGFRGEFAGQELRRGMEREVALGFLNRLGALAGHPGGEGVRHSMAGSPAGGGAMLGTPGLSGDGLGMAATSPIGGGLRMAASDGPDGRLDGRGLLSMGLGGGDLLTGSAFALNRETRHGGILSIWSRGAQSHFAGREGVLSLGGDVRTTMFGADYAKGPLVMGLSLSHSRGVGEYSGAAAGQVASAVTGLYPWLGYQASDRVTVWGVAGYGSGGMLLTPAGGSTLEAGLSMAMAAAGTRGELVAGGAGGFELAFKTDALWVGTGTESVDGPAGRLAATEAAVTRFRTGLEGSTNYTLAGRLSLKPVAEVGLRHDGGNAETGTGIDLGGGLVLSDSSTGLAVDVRVRTLLVHQHEGFRERGVSVSLSYNPTPSTPMGFVARVAPSWGGQAASGAEALWGRETMAGMAHGGLAQGNRLDGEVGYGLPVGSRFVGTPRVVFTTSEHGRDYRVGYGLGVLDRESLNFELGVEAQRRESPLLEGTSNGVLGRASLGW